MTLKWPIEQEERNFGINIDPTDDLQRRKTHDDGLNDHPMKHELLGLVSILGFDSLCCHLSVCISADRFQTPSIREIKNFVENFEYLASHYEIV
jgi:hypothetical protein